MKKLIIIGPISVFLVWLCVYVPIFGLHYETARGEHTGYITSTETHGIIFKNNRVYLKTDTQSSQEDDYCVIDTNIFEKLKSASENKSHVNVKFFSWFSSGVNNCGAEGAIIYDLVLIK